MREDVNISLSAPSIDTHGNIPSPTEKKSKKTYTHMNLSQQEEHIGTNYMSKGFDLNRVFHKNNHFFLVPGHLVGTILLYTTL